MPSTYALDLPPTDVWGTPVSKMPNCPNCGEDELGLIEPDRGLCYVCQCVVVRKAPSITETPAACGNCPWVGTVVACDVNESTGDLLCPQCYTIITILVPDQKGGV